MRPVRSLLVLSLLALGAPPLAAQARDAIAKLEAERAANPSSVAALRALGVAYYKGQRYADAPAGAPTPRSARPSCRRR